MRRRVPVASVPEWVVSFAVWARRGAPAHRCSPRLAWCYDQTSWLIEHDFDVFDDALPQWGEPLAAWLREQYPVVAS